MATNKHRNTNELYRSMLTLNVFVGIILLVMGGYLYSFYYRTLLKDYFSANEQYQETIINRQENDLNVMENIVTQLALSEDITLFQLDEQPIKSRALIDRIYQYTKVSQSFSQMYYANRRDHYLYNGTTSIEVELFLKEGMLLSDTQAEELRADLYDSVEMQVLPEQQATGYLITRYGDISDHVVLFFLPVIPQKNGTALFVVGNRYYDELLENSDGRETLIVYRDRVIAKRGDLQLSLADLGDRESLPEDRFLKIKGESYAVSRSFGESGLEYITIQPAAGFYGKFVQGQWSFFFITILSFLLLSTIILGIRRNVGRKVKTLSSLLNEEDESFETIEKGIKALDAHKKASEVDGLKHRRARFINDFICDGFTDDQQMLEQAALAQLDIRDKQYVVALCGEKGNGNERKANDVILGMLKAEKKLTGYGLNLIAKRQSLFVIFGEEEGQIREFLEKMLSAGKEHCETFILAAGNFHGDYREASKAYLEADAAYDNRFLSDNDAILYYADVATMETIRELPAGYMQSLKNAIRQGQKEDLEKTVDEICRHMQQNGQSLLGFRILCNEIIHLLITARDDHTNKDVFSVYTLSQCMTVQDFRGVLLDVCRGLMQDQETMSQNEDPMVQRAIRYIRENYADADFTMSVLAEKLGVSSVTLSVNFKNEMDISPSDYLATVRMDKAKELLRTTDLKIRDISLEVGYEDDHVFTRRFKKYTGKTPGQYRSEHYVY